MKMEEIEKLEEAARKYSGVDKIRLAFWDGAKWQFSQSRWIPVGERLPDNKSTVLVCSGFIIQIKISYYSGKYGFENASNVTHWMDLPQKPEQ